MQPIAARTIEVDFPFDAEVVLKGFRNSQHRQFLGRAPVLVREVDAAALTPAIEIENHRERHDALAPVGGRTVLSFCDGNNGVLWTPLLDPDGRPVDVETFVRSLGHDAPFRIGNPFDLDRPHLKVPESGFRPFAADAKTGFPTERIEDVPIRKAVSSRAEAAARDAQAVADALLIAGGVVHYRCHEPFWSAHPYKDEAFLVFGPEDDAPGGTQPRMETFRADRRDDMIAWRRRWHEAEGKVPPLSGAEGTAKVLRADAIERVDLAYACRGLKSLAHESFEFFREASADAIVDWARLRDASRLLEHGWSAELGAEALDAVAGLRQAFASLPVRGIGYSRNAFETAHYACRRLLARAHWFEGWDNPRDVELSVDDDKAIEAMDDWKPGGGPP